MLATWLVLLLVRSRRLNYSRVHSCNQSLVTVDCRNVILFGTAINLFIPYQSLSKGSRYKSIYSGPKGQYPCLQRVCYGPVSKFST